MDKYSNNELQEAQSDMSSSVGSVSIGVQLRQAREAKRLTVEQIASEMRLATSLINDIENNQFGTLPTTFIKGYIRSYAKLVSLDPDILIAQYSAGHEPENHDPFYRSSIEKEHSAPRANAMRNFKIPGLNKINFSAINWAKFMNIRYISYAIAALIVLIIGVILLHHYSSEREVSAAPVDTPSALPAQITPGAPVAPPHAALQGHPETTKSPNEVATKQLPAAPASAAQPMAAKPAAGSDNLTDQLNMDN